jgi:DNA repair exonuclease SbcCD nuclease subunit
MIRLCCGKRRFAVWPGWRSAFNEAAMTTFKFLHAADLHLDSPLVGLTAKSASFAEAVETASRQALDNLVDLAIAEGCRFVVLAGDVFDGDLRDFHTGLFFLAAMRRLEAADIRVFMVAGNHDAENRFADKLRFSDNVHRFAHRRPESVAIDDLDVVVHGQGFGQRDVFENLAMTYPPPRPGRFNIGVLHTACAGSEGEHRVYAPCTLEQLVRHGYQYWALGHVHARLVLSEHPHVVYPGNLQGRNARETGPKGATIVEVVDGEVASCVHHVLDEVRWASERVDVAGAADHDGLLGRVRAALVPVCVAAGERPLALRLRLTGETPVHAQLALDPGGLREDVEALLANLPTEVWLERLDLATRAPAISMSGADPTVAGRLEAEIKAMGEAAEALAMLEASLAALKIKMPAGERTEALFARMRAEAPSRAVDLALSLVVAEARTAAPTRDAPRSDELGNDLAAG